MPVAFVHIDLVMMGAFASSVDRIIIAHAFYLPLALRSAVRPPEGDRVGGTSQLSVIEEGQRAA